MGRCGEGRGIVVREGVVRDCGEGGCGEGLW